jgi:hypothetical protein
MLRGHRGGAPASQMLGQPGLLLDRLVGRSPRVFAKSRLCTRVVETTGASRPSGPSRADRLKTREAIPQGRARLTSRRWLSPTLPGCAAFWLGRPTRRRPLGAIGPPSAPLAAHRHESVRDKDPARATGAARQEVAWPRPTRQSIGERRTVGRTTTQVPPAATKETDAAVRRVNEEERWILPRSILSTSRPSRTGWVFIRDRPLGFRGSRRLGRCPPRGRVHRFRSTARLQAASSPSPDTVPGPDPPSLHSA